MHASTVKTASCALALALLSACSANTAPSTGSSAASAPVASSYGAVRGQVIDRSAEMRRAASALQTAAAAYYELASGAKFNYTDLAMAKKSDVLQRLAEARAAWTNATTSYAYMEAIVAGAAALSDFDVIFDTGTAEGDGEDSVVPFDLKLPDGRTLKKPGNLFGVVESALWSTRKEFRAPGDVAFDMNGDGTFDDTEFLPDAAVLVGAADVFVEQAAALEKAAAAWTPTDKDAYLSLLIMLPSISDYIDAWKGSRFVLGAASVDTDYVAVSRIADLDGVMKGIRILFDAVEPQLRAIDAAETEKIKLQLVSLADDISQTAKAEAGGRRFSTREAAALSDKAVAAGQAMADALTTMAEKAGIKIEE